MDDREPDAAIPPEDSGPGPVDEQTAGAGEPADEVPYRVRRLRHLFETVRREDGQKYTYRQVADAIAAEGGPRISAPYLHAIATGKKANPSLEILQPVAKFFGVSLDYFQYEDDPRDVEKQLATLRMLQESGVRGIALRAVGLQPDQLDLVKTLLEHLRTTSGLPPVPPDAEDPA